MSEAKSRLKEEIEEIFKDRLADPLTGSITAGVIYGIIKEDFRRIETGNWSERYPTTDFMRRDEERDKAAEHIGGFIYCMEAAGLISAEKSDQMQSELTEFVNSIRDQELFMFSKICLTQSAPCVMLAELKKAELSTLTLAQTRD